MAEGGGVRERCSRLEPTLVMAVGVGACVFVVVVVVILSGRRRSSSGSAYDDGPPDQEGATAGRVRTSGGGGGDGGQRVGGSVGVCWVGGGLSGHASVPRLGRDQWLTNDVYAVVLVDICWQNRSPVRHLEWN